MASIKHNITAGMLRLQVPGKQDVFYSEAIWFNEHIPGPFGNIFTDDFSTASFPQRAVFWIESMVKPVPLKVALSPENTVIKCFYEDKYDGSYYNYVSYELCVYVSYEEEEKEITKTELTEE
jgi:hypothetical protein